MFKYMDYIYAVYQTGNFSKAANKLHIAQSALSITIKKAEHNIGMPIFNRHTSPISLTPFGEKYIEKVKLINKEKADLENYICELNYLKIGRLAIGASTFWSIYFVAPAILEFNKKYPNIAVNLYEDITPTLIDNLLKNHLDLIITSSVLENNLYKQYLLCKETLLLVIPRKFCPKSLLEKYALSFPTTQDSADYLSKQPGISLKHFADVPFVLLRSGNTSRSLADRAFEESTINPQIVLEVDQAATSYRLACLGIGATLISNLNILVTGQNSKIGIFKLDATSLQRDVYIYTKKDSILNKAMQIFIETIHYANRQFFPSTKD